MHMKSTSLLNQILSGSFFGVCEDLCVGGIGLVLHSIYFLEYLSLSKASQIILRNMGLRNINTFLTHIF